MGTRLGCLICGDVIESKSRHDFVRCKCGGIFVDGGDDYVRAGAEDLKYIMPGSVDLSELDKIPLAVRLKVATDLRLPLSILKE